MGVRATPDAFGGQVAQAIQQGGNQAAELTDHYAKMATEAKVNDVIANQWAPAVAQLSGQYHEKQGIDAVAGLKPFQDNMAALHNQYLANAGGPYEKQLLGNYMSRHIAQEMDGAQRHQDQQLTSYEDQSHKAFVDTLSNNAVSNYNNPYVVDGTFNQMDAQIEKHGLDRGQSQEMIEEQQRNAKGVTVQSMVGRAVAAGDVATANQIYASNKEYIPGHQQLEIDKMLHSENMRQVGTQNADSFLGGMPKPAGVGGPVAQQARAATAQAAQTVGVDPNHALTVLKIESNDGQNLGKRGDIGQTGKGGELPEQAMNLAMELKKSDDVATKALGRPAQPWEGYACYQQGVGGGPALLKAAQEQPTARAVDVLKGLYSNPKDALSAIVNNGGNATMTAGQYLDFVKQKYVAENTRATCALPAGGSAPIASPIPAEPAKDGQPEAPAQTTSAPPSLSDAILAPSQTSGVAAQPGATPVQALLNLDKVYPDALMRAQQIPNLDERDATIRALEQKRSVYSAAAGAWKSQFMNQAQTLAVNPSFTSVDQIPPDMRAALADSPATMTYLEARAHYNLEHGSGVVTKDMQEYGHGFYDLFKAVHAPQGDPNRINDITQLQQHVGKDGDLTIAGYNKLSKELAGKGTPDGDAEAMMKKQFFANAKAQISGSNEGLHITDPKGDEIFLRFMAQALPAYDKGKSEGKSAAQLLNPDSPEYVGKIIPSFKRPMSQWTSDMMQDQGSAQTRNLGAIIQDVQSGRISSDAGKAEAQKLGLIAADRAPAVPFPKE